MTTKTASECLFHPSFLLQSLKMMQFFLLLFACSHWLRITNGFVVPLFDNSCIRSSNLLFSTRYQCSNNDISHRRWTKHDPFQMQLHAKRKDEDDDSNTSQLNKRENTDFDTTNDDNEPRISMFDIRKEEQSSKQLFQRLLIWDNIGKAWNVVLYSFVALGILLNLFGYGYVPKPENGILSFEIGTLQERQFQLEMQRNMRQPPKQTINEQQPQYQPEDIQN